MSEVVINGVACRILANLYSGTVYIWNTNDQVLSPESHMQCTFLDCIRPLPSRPGKVEWSREKVMGWAWDGCLISSTHGILCNKRGTLLFMAELGASSRHGSHVQSMLVAVFLNRWIMQ